MFDTKRTDGSCTDHSPGAHLAPSAYDSLTQLLDRRHFYAQLQAYHQTNRDYWFVTLDLDAFNRMNIRFGHAVGDALLQQVASRLESFMPENGLIGRIGGDGFALVIPYRLLVIEPDALAEQLLACLSRPFRLDGDRYHLGVTLCILAGQHFLDDVQELIQHAEIGLIEARHQHLAYVYFDERSIQRHRHQQHLQSELKQAIRHGDIHLVYQPIWDNRRGRVGKIEALARWQHPVLGAIAPTEFIQMAEETGLITELGERLLIQACRDLVSLHQLGFDHLQVSINRSIMELDALSLDSREWLDTIRSTGLEPQSVIFELTESLFMPRNKHHLRRIQTLREAGCQLAIDDFGTGYSALNYLRLYPVDIVKIDKSFVVQIPRHVGDTRLLQGMMDMVHRLGMQLVVEGVETAEQQAFLYAHQCHHTQGYFFSKPLNKKDLVEYLQQHQLLSTQMSPLYI